MNVQQIFDALARFPEGPQAEDAARAGFLEWVLCLPDDTSASLAANAALQGLSDAGQSGSAASQFVKFLIEAAEMPTCAPVRRGGRGARMVSRH